MRGVASSMRWTLSANRTNLPFLRKGTFDSTWARTEGHTLFIYLFYFIMYNHYNDFTMTTNDDRC